jgi:hypothetical protein
MKERRTAIGLAAIVTAVMLAATVVWSDSRDVLGCFPPAKQAAISSGRAVVDVAHVEDVDLAVIGAARTTAGGDRLLAWFREIEQMQTGSYVRIVRRFSDPPRLADLSAFALSDQDLESLSECRPARCDIKLSAGEMAALQESIRIAGRRWKPAVQDTFRRLMLDRASRYLAGGFTAALPYEDQEQPMRLGDEFEFLLRDWHPVAVGMPAPAAYLRTPEGSRWAPARESLLYWSMDSYDGAKPVFSITHATLFDGGGKGPSIVTAVQVYASHYLTASVSLTAITVPSTEGARYLVYSRRSRADLFRGTFGGWLRRIARRRIGIEGAAALDQLRVKLETGVPEPRSSR